MSILMHTVGRHRRTTTRRDILVSRLVYLVAILCLTCLSQPLELDHQFPARTNAPGNSKSDRRGRIQHASKDNQAPICPMVLLLDSTRNRDARQCTNTGYGKCRPASLSQILRFTHLRDAHGGETDGGTAPKAKQYRIANDCRHIRP